MLLVACACTPRGSATPDASAIGAVDAALADMAWPKDVELPREGRPRIGMAPLPRPARWPVLRAWQRGEDVWREPSMTPDASVREQEILGAQVFRTYCASCHGITGRGDGPRAARITPRPRDFTRGEYRFRTTASGDAPTPSDLFRTISGGLHGTRMMAFGDLPERQRWAVVGHLQTLSDVFDDEPTPIDVPEVPAGLDDPERARRGHEIYKQLKCATCHGDARQGTGPPRPTVENSRGDPIQVPDLNRHPLKRGNDPRSLFASLATGLDGTPMPSYIDSASPDQIWDLVAMLRKR